MDFERRRLELQQRLREPLIKSREGQGAGAPTYDHAVAEMQMVISDLHDLGNQEIAHAHDLLSQETKKLTDATARLSWATWVLFFVTLALFLVKAYEIIKHGGSL